MTTWIDDLLAKYRNKGIVIDANLLLLYFVGRFDRDEIQRFKRTRSRGYTVDDFKIVSNLVAWFASVVTTPHILTEVSNLSSSLTGSTKKSYFLSIVPAIQVLEEAFVGSADLANAAQFADYGLTDTAILEAATRPYLVFTDDFPLSNLLQSLGRDVLNLNHLRAVKWQLP